MVPGITELIRNACVKNCTQFCSVTSHKYYALGLLHHEHVGTMFPGIANHCFTAFGKKVQVSCQHEVQSEKTTLYTMNN